MESASVLDGAHHGQDHHDGLYRPKELLPLHSIQPQHFVKASLAILFVEIIDNVPHDRISLIDPMKAMAALFQDCFAT